jgi:fructan beta-fructosidase
VDILAISAGTQSTQLYDEPFRPQFHYSAPHAWLNDPNGLVYFEGEYHLFYQYHPNDVIWGPMHWGHAVSVDLIHWETLPIALFPDEHGTIFSGCVVVDAENTSGLVPGGGLVAIFSYHKQTQGVAYSTDRGRTWTKYQDNPILPALRQDFRDPKVFWHETKWVMVLAAGRSIMFLTSPDLLHWETASEFDGHYRGGVWEVPDLFPMRINGVTKWVLIISVNPTAPAGGSGTRYCIGNFDGYAFTDEYPDQILWFDWGADNYAGSTYSNVGDERRLFIGWMNNWAYAEIIPTSVWRGAMTLPRELSLVNTAEGIRLSQHPILALRDLRIPLGVWENIPVEGEMTLDALTGQTLDIESEFALKDALSFGFDFFTSGVNSVRVSYDVNEHQLVFSRPDAGLRNFNTTFSAPLEPVNNRIRLRIVVDRSSVEVFANDGILAMTSQIFPDTQTTQVQLFARNGIAQMNSLRAYQLQSIWKRDQH